ncbi:MAG: acyl-CoA/acyl-ACP dehydrogenase [Candidatus Heimdallarchaeota archaeon]|nr:MAG: acyl-CoA/acyl-ACP dehydrogenase [Candidatus Heimdallarchaeota archaeon]
MKTQLLEDEVLDMMKLENQFGVFNSNMMMILSDEDKAYVEKLQGLCLEQEEKIGRIQGHNTADYYDWFEWAGSHGLITRSVDYPHRDDLEIGMKAELLRCWTMDIFNPQFNMALGASVLSINPISHHHNGRETLLKDLTDLLDGKKIGCIGITEPKRGSDAVNMTVKAEKVDGGYVINGDKCYTTNSPKADICAVYAVLNEEDTRSTMVQGISHKEWDRGFTAERIGIPSVNKVHIGKTIFKDSFIPDDYMTGGPGEGYNILFEGLVPERIGIAATNIGQMWGAFSLAALYSTVRKQFGEKILRHQAVGMSVLAKYHARLMSISMALLKLADAYDAKREDLVGISPFMNPFVANASHMKEEAAQLVHELTYECMHAMGGTGVTDQTKMPLIQGVSEIAEVVGGTRNVQLLIGSRTINTMIKMI